MGRDLNIDLYFPELLITFSYFQNASELFPSCFLQYDHQNKHKNIKYGINMFTHLILNIHTKWNIKPRGY